MEQKWSIRAYQEGDERGIFELRKAVYPQRTYISEDRIKLWNWIYKENPAGVGKIWIAESNGKIVGHRATIPIRIKIGDEVITVFQSLDGMTHPEYRRQGIFEILDRSIYAEAAKEGICIIYGFANEISHRILTEKLDWFDIATTQVWTKPLNWTNTVRLRVKNRFLSRLLVIGATLVLNKMFFRARKTHVVEGLTVSQIPSFDDRINTFWNKISNQYQIIVVRNKNHLNWRYVAVPNVNYSIYIAQKEGEIHGYLVSRCRQEDDNKQGVIFDILAQSQEIAHCLVSKAVEQFTKEKVDVIFCHMIDNKMLPKVLRKSGFIFLPLKKDTWFGVRSSSPDISKEFLRDVKNWFVQLGDSDLI